MLRRLTDRIIDKAHKLGFQKVGITKAIHTPVEKAHLETWLTRRYHGTMEWMAKRKEERGDLLQYFPEVKSVISVGMNYFHGNAKGNMKISNYAWGDDYHDLMKDKLYQLLLGVQEYLPEVKGLVCVDTSPLMEKMWAQRAGLGWQGKHTNLISRDFGSWLFLGELLLDCELVYDDPFEDDLCGSCTACLDACPTGAIVEEYLLDSSRCISYLTIEHRGDLPGEFMGQLDEWIYGCDVCQEVCPWNIKFSQKSQEPAFAPKSEIVQKTASEWSNLKEDDFHRIFRKSAVRRANFTGLTRNIQSILILSKQEQL
ncbi:MAG: tRNA epoxyqueuosine(34) reductase QueG [Fidelibacterota bacterium]